MLGALGNTGGFYFFNFFCKNFYKVLAYVKTLCLVRIHIIPTLWH